MFYGGYLFRKYFPRNVIYGWVSRNPSARLEILSKKMKGGSFTLRRLMASRSTRSAIRSSSISENLILSSAATYSTLAFADEKTRPLLFSSFVPGPSANFQYAFQNYSRSFSSPPASDPSNIVLIESKEQLNDSLRKVKDDLLPAIFYFTAVWCGPCRLLSPIIQQLSEKYPSVTIFKIDIDKEELANELSMLNITSVPTLHFFQNGRKASEVIGADVSRVKDTMEALYK